MVGLPMIASVIQMLSCPLLASLVKVPFGVECQGCATQWWWSSMTRSMDCHHYSSWFFCKKEVLIIPVLGALPREDLSLTLAYSTSHDYRLVTDGICCYVKLRNFSRSTKGPISKPGWTSRCYATIIPVNQLASSNLPINPEETTGKPQTGLGVMRI